MPALLEVVPDLADLLPEAPGGPLDPATRRALVLEGAVRMLVAAAPAVAALTLDDLQWADPDSLLVVADLLDRVPGLPAVLAYRPEEAPPGGPLRSALAGLADRRQVQPVALPPLAVVDLGQVLDAEIARAWCRPAPRGCRSPWPRSSAS